MYPNDLKYNAEHTWLRLEDDSIGRIGITHFAQEQLKEVVFVELPEVGSSVFYMEPFGIVESAKATNDLYSPVNGVVVDVNHSLENEPNLINKDPYGEGWIIKVKINDLSETNLLISSEKYKGLINYSDK